MEPHGPFGESYPEPLALAGSGNLQKAAELAAVAALLSQATAQLRARKLKKSAAEDAQEDADRAADGVAKAAAQEWLAKARDAGWLADATLDETAYAWGSALPYEHADPGAAVALDACEVHLRDLHPHAMRIYDRHRRAGRSREDAMRAAMPEFDKQPRSRPAPQDSSGLYLPLTGSADSVETWVLEGPEARVTHKVLDLIRQYQDRAAAAGEGPMSAQVIQMTLMQRTNINPVLAQAILRGLKAGDRLVPGSAAPAAAKSVSEVGPGAADWPAPPVAAVAATVIGKATGGQRRVRARSHPRTPTQGPPPRLHP
jgi:hypothetical protein